MLHACGLVGAESRRGCQPADVKIARVRSATTTSTRSSRRSRPRRRHHVRRRLGEARRRRQEASIEDVWVDRRGARYFFVVARASKTGTPDFNRALSHKRANSVLFLLTDKFKDPDLDKEVGLLWLGNEFAQLGKEYCDWNASRDKKKCTARPSTGARSCPGSTASSEALRSSDG